MFQVRTLGVGCHSLLQGIFLTQGLKPGLLHCRQIFYSLSHQGRPTGRLALKWSCSHQSPPLSQYFIKFLDDSLWLKLGSLRGRSWDEDLSTSHLFWGRSQEVSFRQWGMETGKGRSLVGGELLKRSPCRHPGLLPSGASYKLCRTWLRAGAPEGKDAGEIVV